MRQFESAFISFFQCKAVKRFDNFVFRCCAHKLNFWLCEFGQHCYRVFPSRALSQLTIFLVFSLSNLLCLFLLLLHSSSNAKIAQLQLRIFALVLANNFAGFSYAINVLSICPTLWQAFLWRIYWTFVVRPKLRMSKQYAACDQQLDLTTSY